MFTTGRKPQDSHYYLFIVFCRKYLIFHLVCFSDISRLSYKLLFVRQDPGSITLGGKPSLRRSCCLEAELFSHLGDSTPSFHLPLSSIFLSITHLTPCSTVCLDQTGLSSLPDFQLILETVETAEVETISVSLCYKVAAMANSTFLSQL